MDERKLLSFQRAVDGLAGALLPDAAGLLITHQRIAVVDARETEFKSLAVEHAAPDKPSVTESAVSGRNRLSAYYVVYDVMVPHGANGEGMSDTADLDGEDFVIGIDPDRADICKCWVLVGMEHDLEDVDLRSYSSRQDDERAQREAYAQENAGALPGAEQNKQDDDGADGSNPGS